MNKRDTYGIIADNLRFATQLSNVYGNAIRAKLANAQTTRSVADSFSSFLTQNLQSLCSLYHRHLRFFHKSSGCGKAKEKQKTKEKGPSAVTVVRPLLRRILVVRKKFLKKRQYGRNEQSLLHNLLLPLSGCSYNLDGRPESA